ncbi:MAG: methyltransferase domain-containing protein [Deltaproteobacteria bacterium]|nr:methyltransferase domain-containing protein [Deltaproteobacteria bacterium]
MANNEDSFYQPENIEIFEAIYGNGLISLGGLVAVDKMFEESDLNGKYLLDIGFGLGGMAHYLAETKNAYVTGLEVHPWMTQHATKTAPFSIKDRVKFVVYNEDNTIPLASESIDLAYSKGVLTNVQDKKSLFLEISRVLKIHGQICLIDWLNPSAPRTEKLHTGELSYKENKKSYCEILESCGFKDITFRDESSAYLGYAKDLGHKLQSPEHISQFSDIFSKELRNTVITSNTKLIESISSGAQLSYLIRAIKT